MPLTVTTEPALTVVGATLVTVGLFTRRVNFVLDVEPLSVCTVITPDVVAHGTTAVIAVAEIDLMSAGTPLNETVASDEKFVPVIVTTDPASADLGVNVVTVGANCGAVVNSTSMLVSAFIVKVQVVEIPQAGIDHPAI